MQHLSARRYIMKITYVFKDVTSRKLLYGRACLSMCLEGDVIDG